MSEHRPNEIARGVDGGLHGYDAPRPDQQLERELAEARAKIAEWGSRYAVAADELEQWKRQAFEMQSERMSDIYVECYACLGTGEGTHERSCAVCGGSKVVKKSANEVSAIDALRHFAERFAEILDRLATEQEVVAFDKRPPSVIPRTLREVAEAARELQREMK